VQELFDLREEPCVSDEVDRAYKIWDKAEDAWEFLKWVVVRDPTIGRPLNEKGDLRSIIWVGAKSTNLPDTTLIYRKSDPIIELLDVQFTEPKYAQTSRG
jgi:hypothetical protein